MFAGFAADRDGAINAVPPGLTTARIRRRTIAVHAGRIANRVLANRPTPPPKTEARVRRRTGAVLAGIRTDGNRAITALPARSALTSVRGRTGSTVLAGQLANRDRTIRALPGRVTNTRAELANAVAGTFIRAVGNIGRRSKRCHGDGFRPLRLPVMLDGDHYRFGRCSGVEAEVIGGSPAQRI